MSIVDLPPIEQPGASSHHQGVPQATSSSAESDMLDVLAGKKTLAAVNDLDNEALEEIYRLGYEAWQVDDIASATKHFMFLALHQPRDYRFQFALGCALQQQGQWLAALRAFGLAHLLQIEDPLTLYHIAECLLALGENEGARDALQTVINWCRQQAPSGRIEAVQADAQKLLQQVV